MAFTPFTKDDKPTMAAFNEKFMEAIETAIAGGFKAEIGSYVGDGETSGTRTLEFSFKPMMLIIHSTSSLAQYCGGYTWLRGATVGRSGSNPYATSVGNLKWTANTVQWDLAPDYNAAMNTPGTKYNYIALGDADELGYE